MPDPAIVAHFAPLFRPRVVAAIGASATGVTPGNEFLRSCRAMGFDGRLVAIHPTAESIDGVPCLRSFAEVGETIDYAYVAVAAAQVRGLLEAAAGRIRFAQVMASGFGETEGGAALERDLLATARAGGMRILGPNCMGIHSPRGRMSYVAGALRERGTVGIVSQSGGLGSDIVRRGQNRGLRFSGLVTIGNSADIGPAELLEFYLADPETRVIGMYLEDAKDGRRFFEALRAARGRKPVVLLLGGQTGAGRRAAVSHTGSLASDTQVWAGLARQTGLTLTRTLPEFLNALLAFQMLGAPGASPAQRVVLLGNGGGTSVLATDAFTRAGLRIDPLSQDAQQAITALRLPPGTSLANPIDAPAGALRQDDGRIAERILEAIYRFDAPDLVVMHLNLAVFLSAANRRADVVENLVSAAMRVRERHAGGTRLALVLRSDGSELPDAQRRQDIERLVPAGVPVFEEMADAAEALAALSRFERFAEEFRPGAID